MVVVSVAANMKVVIRREAEYRRACIAETSAESSSSG